MLRPDREPRGEDPLLLIKMTLFVIASAVAFTGMALQRPLIIFLAIVLLGVGFLLRFLRRGDVDAEDSGEAAPDTSDDDAHPSDRSSA